MTREELNEALLRYGGRLGRWPADRAAAAERLAAGDPLAAKMIADFAAFERTLALAAEAPPFGAAEIGKVLAAIDADKGGWWPAPRFWIAGAGLSAASFVAGFAVMLSAIAANDIPASVIALAFGQAELGGLL